MSQKEAAKAATLVRCFWRIRINTVEANPLRNTVCDK
jgi:hypothetical protein